MSSSIMWIVPKPHLPGMINRSVKVVLSKVNKGGLSQGKSRSALTKHS